MRNHSRKKMGAENAALFDALTSHLEVKIDAKFETMSKAMELVVEKTDDGLIKMREEMEEEKKEVKEFGRQLDQVKKQVEEYASGNVKEEHANASARTPGHAGPFRPKQVFVQGFYDYESGKGSLNEEDVDALVATLIQDVPAILKEKFEVEKHYKESRNIEECWEL